MQKQFPTAFLKGVHEAAIPHGRSIAIPAAPVQPSISARRPTGVIPTTCKDKNRRGLYVYWKRGVPYPSFMAFDSSKRETCTVTRTRTTTPLQALVTLNDPVYAEAGRHLGKRLLKEGGKDDKSRIAYGFKLVASRDPDSREVDVLNKLLADLRKVYSEDEKAAKEVLGLVAPKKSSSSRSRGRSRTAVKKPEEKPKKQGKDEPKPAEAAAWAQMGCTLLNLEAAIRRG